MHQQRRHQLSVPAVVLLIFLVAACTSPGRRRDMEPALPSPAGSAATPLRTIADSEIGDQLTVTTALVTIISERSFVVRDVDLPHQGLLALGLLPAHARPPDLLTLRGVIDTFDFERMARAYKVVPDTATYKFRDHKILIAHDVRSWA